MRVRAGVARRRTPRSLPVPRLSLALRPSLAPRPTTVLRSESSRATELPRYLALPRHSVVGWAIGLITWLGWLAFAGPLPAQEEDDENPFAPGLIATYIDASGRTLQRLDTAPLVAGAGPEVDERLVPGAIRVRWQGRLWVQQPGTYRMACYVRGRVKLVVAGRVLLECAADQPAWHVSEPLEWEFERYPVEIEYQAPETEAVLAFYWSSSAFPLEPIATRWWLHEREMFPRAAAGEGRDLVRALRCAACHDLPAQPPLLPAPALDRLAGHLHRGWLAQWLSATAEEVAEPMSGGMPAPRGRRMPHVVLKADEVHDLAAFLFTRSRPAPPAPPPPSGLPSAPAAPRATPKPEGKTRGAAGQGPRVPDAAAGRVLLRTVGCLACHRHEGLGTRDLFDGGDLSGLAHKRPSDFLARWLVDPQAIQRDHRMPVFELTADERADLVALLLPAGGTNGAPSPSAATGGDAARGAVLFRQRGCAACHEGPDGERRTPVSAPALREDSAWDRGCTGEPAADGRRPGYRLNAAERATLQQYVTQLPRRETASSLSGNRTSDGREWRALTGGERVRESQCLACHARDEGMGNAAVAASVVRSSPELAPLLPSFSPPSLTGVGDKLLDSALDAAVRRAHGGRRPWLAVRMPRFAWSDAEVAAVVAHWVARDRIPEGAPAVMRPSTVVALEQLHLLEPGLRNTGGRLATADGFGCTSCHPVGSVQPPPAPLNARGPDLLGLGTRIRASWFDRWVRSPARIVPRMEMPSVQLAVRGVLEDRLDHQLAAVWHALNLPGFTPPEPNPVQTLRLSGLPNEGKRAEVITDLVVADGKTWIKPFLVGLPNRHNLLFDLETNSLSRWWLGDVARQRTKGKSWYWEPAGVDLWRGPTLSTGDVGEWWWDDQGSRRGPVVRGQFPTELDGWQQLSGGGVLLRQRLEFTVGDAVPSAAESRAWTLEIRQSFQALDPNSLAVDGGWVRRWEFPTLPRERRLRFRAVPVSSDVPREVAEERRVLTLQRGLVRLELRTVGATWDDDGTVLVPLPPPGATGSLEIAYRTSLPNDQFVAPMVPRGPAPVGESLDVAPGWVAERLPLDDRQMPTALAWRPDGGLLVASLKGRVWLVRDTDGDGREDAWQAFSDELAAPYGIAAVGEAVDVTTKSAVLRLWDDDHDGQADHVESVASGWGHTADYHDWTVGLPSDGAGGYFVGLACQQDRRSAAAARLRGTVVHLVAPPGGLQRGQRFTLEPLTAGHRFPMGLARNLAGELFVTDNQGNYNPFNELNHVRPGRRYGFINAVEQRPDFHPPIEPAAIEIPHPWTRSVNGICFLEAPGLGGTTPSAAAAPDLAARPFGPFTGHLVGCEYDTRRLVRMSLQRVGETFQGGVYPLTYDEPRGAAWLLGPLCCAVSPRGALYVGGIRDSGWGGGNNRGEIVRLRLRAETLPAGIAEVRATSDGFVIEFTRPLDPQRLQELRHYGLSSYRRQASPAYGGPDLDRRDELPRAVEVEDGGRRVRLRLAELRFGYVYEFRLRELVPAGEPFHPAEAYFTLRAAVSE
ncbi:MAG: hypothetical protein U0935_11340 [Pirellulales bacterium]